MVRRSRSVLAAGLALAVGVSGFAIAGTTGSDNQVSTVGGKVAPKKLSKKKFKPVNLTTGVTTLNEDPGTDGNTPVQETQSVAIDFDKDIKFVLRAADKCDVTAANIAGTDTLTAEAACGSGAKISRAGDAAARFAGFGGPPFNAPNDEIGDFQVTAFRGNEGDNVYLHAYSPTLGGPNTQIVVGDIVKAPSKKYGQRLDVPEVPPVAGGEGALVRFFATISKASKTVKARCKGKDKDFDFRATFVYADDSGDTAKASAPCKRK